MQEITSGPFAVAFMFVSAIAGAVEVGDSPAFVALFPVPQLANPRAMMATRRVLPMWTFMRTIYVKESPLPPNFFEPEPNV